MCRCEVHPPAGRAGAEGEEIMTLLTAAECREIADRKMLEAETPLGRIAQPEDIARAAVFFATDDSGWVTGESLIVSGGKRG